MAANAYILINTEPPKTRDVVERLNTLRGLVVREVLGPYDIVVELNQCQGGMCISGVLKTTERLHSASYHL